MKKTIEFGKFAIGNKNRKSNLITVDIRLEYKDNSQRNYIDLSEVSGYYELGISASVWNNRRSDCIMGGQCLDSLLPYLKNNPLFMEIYNIWIEYHLNNIQAGTLSQQEAVKDFKGDYKAQCEYLKSINLYEINGFKYGHEWLLKVIPNEIIEKIKNYQNL